jgi:hypothetical protein
LTVFVVLFLFGFSYAQVDIPRASPNAKIEQTVGLSKVTISYSRPGVKERDIFGNLVPYGEVWRTGANENTKISTDKDLIFGDFTIPAGEYAIYTIPNADKWDLIFYSDSNNWGLPTYWDETKVIAKVEGKPFNINYKVERFTIGFSNIHDNGATIEITWDDTRVEFPFRIETDIAVMNKIESTLKGPNANDYYTAATYYNNSNKDLKKAIKWIDMAIEMTSKEPKYWFYRQKALIYAKSGDKRVAIKAAKTSMRLAEQAGAELYVKMNKESIEKWK